MIKSRGFTLIELMVAVAIFAVLSALGWKVFDHVVKVKERNSQHEQSLEGLQKAYQQLLRDSLHVVPINASQNGEIESAYLLENNRMRFSKAGVSDPLQQGLAPHERIEYRYDADTQAIYRDKYTAVHQTGQLQAVSHLLLDQVSGFEIVALNPEPIEKWPLENIDNQDENQLSQLPQGFSLTFIYQGESYEWLYRLLPKAQDTAVEGLAAASEPVVGVL
jgi:general secretion pathway protein J